MGDVVYGIHLSSELGEEKGRAKQVVALGGRKGNRGFLGLKAIGK
jgi:hypothetical protein